METMAAQQQGVESYDVFSTNHFFFHCCKKGERGKNKLSKAKNLMGGMEDEFVTFVEDLFDRHLDLRFVVLILKNKNDLFV